MGLIETNDIAAIPSRDLIEWLTRELNRLIKKVDGATGFAVNDHRTLAVGPSGSSGNQDDRPDVRFIITGRTVITSNQKWKYTAQLLSITGSDDDTLGMKPNESLEFDAYNTWEEIPLAGYENENVTGLKTIPDDARLPGWWGNIGGETVIIFENRNEPACGSSS